MVAPSKHGVHELAGLMETARLMTVRRSSARRAPRAGPRPPRCRPCPTCRASGRWRGPRGAAQARVDLVAGDHASSRAAPVEAELLGRWRARRQHVNGGMTTAPAIALVDLQGHSGRRVDERGQHRLRSLHVAEQRGHAASGASGGQLGEPPVLRRARLPAQIAPSVSSTTSRAARARAGSQRLDTDVVGRASQPRESVVISPGRPRQRRRGPPAREVAPDSPASARACPRSAAPAPRSSVIHGRPRTFQPS